MWSVMCVAYRRIGGAVLLSLVSTGAMADCISDAAQYHQVPPIVLRAIAWEESRLNPSALGKNKNGSVDIGLFQINSIHLPTLQKYGINKEHLGGACVNAYVGAWILAREIHRSGDLWYGVGAYHSKTPVHHRRYTDLIKSRLKSWGHPVR